MPTKGKVPAVLVRFIGVDLPLAKQVKSLSEKNGISASKIGTMAIRLGLPMLKEELEGLKIDLDCSAEFATFKGQRKLEKSRGQ